MGGFLQSSHQDFSIEGSNFFLSQLEVGCWAAQTLPFLEKLQILAFYINPRIRHGYEFFTL